MTVADSMAILILGLIRFANAWALEQMAPAKIMAGLFRGYDYTLCEAAEEFGAMAWCSGARPPRGAGIALDEVRLAVSLEVAGGQRPGIPAEKRPRGPDRITGDSSSRGERYRG